MQLCFFENFPRRVSPGGCFLLEALVPDVARFIGRQTGRGSKSGSDEVRLKLTQWKPVEHPRPSKHVVLTEQGIRLYPVKLRYVWPSELELMARLAGLRLRQRWANWDRAGFTADSTKHISVYERAA